MCPAMISGIVTEDARMRRSAIGQCFFENPQIRMTETRFYKPARLSTPPPPPHTLVFTKTCKMPSLVEVVVI